MKSNAWNYVYLNDEKTHVDPWLLNAILWGLKALCVMEKCWRLLSEWAMKGQKIDDVL